MIQQKLSKHIAQHFLNRFGIVVYVFQWMNIPFSPISFLYDLCLFSSLFFSFFSSAYFKTGEFLSKNDSCEISLKSICSDIIDKCALKCATKLEHSQWKIGYSNGELVPFPNQHAANRMHIEICIVQLVCIFIPCFK